MFQNPYEGEMQKVVHDWMAWHLSDDQKFNLDLAARKMSPFPFAIFATCDSARVLARHKWPYSQDAFTWAAPKTEGLHIIISPVTQTVESALLNGVRELFSRAGIPLAELMGTEGGLDHHGLGPIGIVIGARPLSWT